MPGVVAVVRDGSFLAVVCAREEQAIKAREALTERAVLDARRRICRHARRHVRPALIGAAVRGQRREREDGAEARPPAKRIEARYTPRYQLPRLDRPVVRGRAEARTAS